MKRRSNNAVRIITWAILVILSLSGRSGWARGDATDAGQVGAIHPLPVQAGSRLKVAERAVSSRTAQKPEVIVQGDGSLRNWLIFAGICIVLLGGTLYKVRRIMRLWYRQGWQGKAEEGELPETCELGTRHCRKIELAPARRKVVHLSLVALDPASDQPSRVRQLKGRVVDGLNRTLWARRQGEDPEKMQRMVASLAQALGRDTGRWLRRERGCRDVSITGHLQGNRVLYQFTVYRCQRRGIVNGWEEEDTWKAAINDERDVHVGILRSVYPSDREMEEPLLNEMKRQLTRFIETV
jgi:hypothetical protein